MWQPFFNRVYAVRRIDGGSTKCGCDSVQNVTVHGIYILDARYFLNWTWHQTLTTFVSTKHLGTRDCLPENTVTDAGVDCPPFTWPKAQLEDSMAG